jgi:hypothetical protein
MGGSTKLHVSFGATSLIARESVGAAVVFGARVVTTVKLPDVPTHEASAPPLTLPTSQDTLLGNDPPQAYGV